MTRNIVLALLGCALGAGAMHWMRSPEALSPQNAISGPALSTVMSDRTVDDLDLVNSPFVAERAAAYRRASEFESFVDIEAAIDTLLASLSVDGSDVVLQALLLRLVDSDPQRALRFARDREVDLSLIVFMFRAWASVNHGAAIAELEMTRDRSLARSVALELVDLVVANGGSIEQLALLFDDNQRLGFASDALVRLSESDPQDALRKALAMDAARFRESTARRIGAMWVRQNPRAAVAVLPDIEDPRLRHSMHISMVIEWASTNPDAALEYMTTGEGQALFLLQRVEVSHVVDALVRHRPYEALAAAERLRGEAGQQLRRAALRSIVSQDISSAVARIQTLPAGRERDEMLYMVARTFVQEDASGAVRWGEQVQQFIPGALGEVHTAMAVSDLPQAVTLALEHPETAGMIRRWVTSHALSSLDPPAMRDLADMLHASGPSQSASVAHMMRLWGGVDGEAALTWLLEQGDEIDRDHLRNLAIGFGAQHPGQSAAAVHRLPGLLRGQWISEVGDAYLRREPDAALAWFATLRGEPEYDAWVSAAIEQKLARPSVYGPVDPYTVISLLDTVGTPTALAIERAVANWAQQDPRAAGNWASGLHDPDARSAGVATATQHWAIHDLEAAERWAQGLPGSEIRDSALRAVLVQGIASHGSIDSGTLNAFSSGRARNEAISLTVNAFINLGSREPDAARALASAHVEDTELLALIGDGIDEIRRAGVTAPRDNVLRISGSNVRGTMP